MRIFLFIILFFALIVGGIWYGYQYFSQGTNISQSDLEQFIGFKLPPDAQKLDFFNQQGFNQIVYIYFQLDNTKFDDFVASLPCQKTFDDVTYTNFISEFQQHHVDGEKNPSDQHQAFECNAGNKTYQLAVYPHQDYKNVYLKIFTL